MTILIIGIIIIIIIIIFIVIIIDNVHCQCSITMQLDAIDDMKDELIRLR